MLNVSILNEGQDKYKACLKFDLPLFMTGDLIYSAIGISSSNIFGLSIKTLVFETNLANNINLKQISSDASISGHVLFKEIKYFLVNQSIVQNKAKEYMSQVQGPLNINGLIEKSSIVLSSIDYSKQILERTFEAEDNLEFFIEEHTNKVKYSFSEIQSKIETWILETHEKSLELSKKAERIEKEFEEFKIQKTIESVKSSLKKLVLVFDKNKDKLNHLKSIDKKINGNLKIINDSKIILKELSDLKAQIDQEGIDIDSESEEITLLIILIIGGIFVISILSWFYKRLNSNYKKVFNY